jgi:2-dehydropantoate 2-reductase
MTLATTRIAVIGTGANGASIGADMIRRGLSVTYIEQWPAHVEAMRSNGLVVRYPDGESQTTAVDAIHVCQVAELTETFDIVFMSVKSYDTRWTVELIRPLLHDGSVVVGLQNGMTIDDVADIVGPERTIGAVLGIAANMEDPGIVNRQLRPADTWIAVGTLSGEVTPQLELVRQALSCSARVEVSTDIRAAKWMKLIANIPEMLPSAILDLPLLAATRVPGIRPVMDEAAREAYELARDLEIAMVPIFGKTEAEVPDSSQYALDLLDAVLASYSLPDTRVAVLQDWGKGRRAELDAFSGYIVEKRRALGGRAPVNEAVLALAERIEAGRLRPGITNADLLAGALETAEVSARG